MSAALIKWLFTRVLPGVLLCAVLGGAGWYLHHTGYNAGHDAAKAAGDTALATEKRARADERQQLTQESNTALLAVRAKEQAQRERANELAAQLTTKESELQQAKSLLSIEINKVVSDDNKTAGSCGFNGLGPRSLQLYEKALGYAGGGDTRAGHSAGR